MNEMRVKLLLGSEHSCGYLPEKRARSAFIDAGFGLSPIRYGALLDQGFRRSGGYVYRPMCLHCTACQPARILASSFNPDRSQRRCARHNADLRRTVRSTLDDEHFQLYRNYLRARHPAGGMDPNDEQAFHEFLGCPWGQTEFWEFRSAAQLMAVAVVDRIPQGLSAVYTFFDPAQQARGLGTYAILEQLRIARLERLPYVYLGYWVAGSPTMNYKRRFSPLQLLGPSGWKLMEPG